MDAADSYIPTPTRENDKPFLLAVEDPMTISGRGTAGTGRVGRGTLQLNGEVEVRELLTSYGFDGDNAPVIRGAALKGLEGDAP